MKREKNGKRKENKEKKVPNASQFTDRATRLFLVFLFAFFVTPPKGGGYSPISFMNGLTVPMHPSYNQRSMLTCRAMATITMGNRMNPGPGIGGVRAQA